MARKKKISFELETYMKEKETYDLPKVITLIISLYLVYSSAASIGLISIGLAELLFLFVVLPFLQTIYVAIEAVKENHDINNQNIWKGFKGYFSIRTIFFGCFDVIRGLLKSVLIGVIVSFVITTIYSYSNYETLNSLGEEMLLLMNSQDYEGLEELMNNNELLNQVVSISSLVSSLAMILYFIARCFKYLFNINIRNFALVVGPRAGNKIFRTVLKQHRREIFHDAFKYSWFVYVGILVVGFGVAAVPYFLGHQDSCLIFGVSAAFLYAICFLPYLNKLNNGLTVKYSHYFSDEANIIIKDFMMTLQNASGISEEDKEEIKQKLSQMHEDANIPFPDMEDDKNESEDDPFDDIK